MVMPVNLKNSEQGMVRHIYNPPLGRLKQENQVPYQPGLHSKFQGNLEILAQNKTKTDYI
jgi:hypothetical protein